VNGRLRDLAAFVSWLDKQEELRRKVRVPTVKLPKAEFEVFTDQDLIAIFFAPHPTAQGMSASTAQMYEPT
jgi:hypothetical protein